MIANDIAFRYKGGFGFGPAGAVFREGTITGLIGPNGSGKTTFLSLLAGLLKPASGTIALDGIACDDVTLRASVAFVRTEGAWYGELTFEEHAVYLSRFFPEWSHETYRALATRFSAPTTKRMANVSAGEKAKLGVLLALARNAKVLLLDEPWNALDPPSREELSAFLLDVRSFGRTIVVSSHELEQLARICDNVLSIESGSIFRSERLTTSVERSTASLMEMYPS